MKAALMGMFAAGSSESLQEGIARVVVPREEIARRIDELASQIAECYRGEEVILLAVLTGSLVFLADLIRRLPLRIRVEVMSASSYPNDAIESQGLRMEMLPKVELTGRHVLVVDDILDTGRTLEGILEHIRSHRPVSLRACVLLRKERQDTLRRITPDFCGFTVPQEFVVGYGLDFNNLYRNLPDVCVLKEEISTGEGVSGAEVNRSEGGG